mmetsp:Transcript_72507/g.204989  ORF Transcript_72507/g.204989 Transcript_72507/m.204989 type:complete len:219 (-) Transcript_72507:245-901(-)
MPRMARSMEIRSAAASMGEGGFGRSGGAARRAEFGKLHSPPRRRPPLNGVGTGRPWGPLRRASGMVAPAAPSISIDSLASEFWGDWQRRSKRLTFSATNRPRGNCGGDPTPSSDAGTVSMELLAAAPTLVWSWPPSMSGASSCSSPAFAWRSTASRRAAAAASAASATSLAAWRSAASSATRSLWVSSQILASWTRSRRSAPSRTPRSSSSCSSSRRS